MHASESVERETYLSRIAPSVTRVVICVSWAFCSTDQEKRETARSLFCRLSSYNLYIRLLPSTLLNDFISLWFPRDFRNTLFIVRATPLVFSLVVPPRVSHLKEISFFLKENRHPFSLKNTRKVNIPYPCLRQTSKFHLQASYLVCINEVIFFASLPGQRRL